MAIGGKPRPGRRSRLLPLAVLWSLQVLDIGGHGTGSIRGGWSALGWAVVGAGIASILWVTVSSGSSKASTGNRTVVDAFLAAVQQPTSAEFPSPDSAIRFLVEQVRTQNLADVTRVLPIDELYEHETFEWRATWLESIDLESFFPGQPLSKLETVALEPLRNVYTDFALDLLMPGFADHGVYTLPDAAAVKRLEAKLDPGRLKGIFVKKITLSATQPASKFLTPGHDPLIEEAVEANVIVGGIGAPLGFDFDLWKVGTNWLMVGVSPA